MKKWVMIIAGIVIVGVVILFVAVLSNLGPVIKTAVNTYGPKITNSTSQVSRLTHSRILASSISSFLKTSHRSKRFCFVKYPCRVPPAMLSRA